MTMNSMMLRALLAAAAGVAAAVTVVGAGGLPGAAVSCQRSVAIDPQVTVSESAQTLTFVVHSTSCGAAGQVSFVVTDGAARRPYDYALADGRLVWGAGETGPRRITATIVGDMAAEEPLEDFKVTLVEASGGVRIVGAIGLGRIFDDDSRRNQATVDDRVCLVDNGSPHVSPSPTRTPSPTASPSPTPEPVPSASVCTFEPGHIVIAPIVLNSPTPTAQSLVFQTSDGDLVANLDYVPVHRMVTIPAGVTAAFVEIKLLPRAFTSGGYFNVHISHYTGGGQIVAGSGQITVAS